MKKLLLLLLAYACPLGAIDEKPMVVVICSYNNAPYYAGNLDSVLGQHYENYRVIYVDDASSDCTGDLVQEHLATYDTSDRCQLVRNDAREGALHNFYHAIHSCADNEIIVELDGDDQLAHEGVLSYINEVYQDDNVWLTYGQYKNMPKEDVQRLGIAEMGYARPVSGDVIAKNNFRRKFVYMALRTFYAGLFKKINKQDLICDKTFGDWEGKFFPEGKDGASMFPMLEMAGPRFKFIPDVLYLRDVSNPINAFKVGKHWHKLVAACLRKKKRYTPLQVPPFEQGA